MESGKETKATSRTARYKNCGRARQHRDKDIQGFINFKFNGSKRKFKCKNASECEEATTEGKVQRRSRAINMEGAGRQTTQQAGARTDSAMTKEQMIQHTTNGAKSADITYMRNAGEQTRTANNRRTGEYCSIHGRRTVGVPASTAHTSNGA